MSGRDLMAGPPPTLLPPDPATAALADPFADPVEIAAAHPDSSAAWAALADRAWVGGHAVESYAYARTGYHRGLDHLRRAGWKGHGSVPWSHEPNQGWLRALNALGRAADAIGETEEAERCQSFLADSSREAVAALS